jgi:type I restriction enzyme S subunit
MGSEWTQITLGELLEQFGGGIKTGPFGTKLKASEYSSDGVPVISVGEVQLGRLVLHERTPRVGPDVTTQMPEYLLHEGDIVFGRKGAVERSARVNAEQSGWFLGSDGIRVRLPKTCDSRFVSYQLLTKNHQQWMIQHSAGTTMASLNEKIVRRVPLVLPPIDIQKEIAGILSALDDKIALNHQINTTLESMAQALFKSWFVDFDPVIDNALAAGNPIPETLQARADARAALGDQRKPLPDHIRQQFPDRFVETEEMGWVPEGWAVEPVGNLIELAYGKSLPGTKRIDGNVPVYGSGGLSGYHNASLVEGPSVIVGRKGTVGSLYWVEEDCFPIDTVFYVVRKSHLPLSWIFQALQLVDIKSMGADSAVPGVNRNVVYATRLVVPQEGVSGELRIPEVERPVAETI